MESAGSAGCGARRATPTPTPTRTPTESMATREICCIDLKRELATGNRQPGHQDIGKPARSTVAGGCCQVAINASERGT